MSRAQSFWAAPGTPAGMAPAVRTSLGSQGRRCLVPLAVSALLLLPLVYYPAGRPPFHLPRVTFGDEPHYLLMINSLIQDGDLDLANNYVALNQGKLDAGAVSAGRKNFDHHTCFLLDGKQIFWQYHYDWLWMPEEKWHPDASGASVPPLMAGKTPPPPGCPEYGTHQPGIAFLLAPLVWPLRGTEYVEPVCLACSGFAVVAAFLFFRMLLGGFTTDRFVIDVVSIAAFLGTPAWFYAHSLLMESFLLFFLCAAYALALRRGAAFWPGVCIALAMQLKAYAILCVLPLAVDCLLRRDARRLLLLSFPVVLGTGAYLLTNKCLYGGFLASPQPLIFRSPRTAALGLLLSPRYGLLFTAPLCAFAAMCWPDFFRTHTRPALILGSLLVGHYAFFACWWCWHGYAFGPRFLIPLLPLFCTPMVGARDAFRIPSPTRRLVFALLLFSIAINKMAVLNSYGLSYWTENPLMFWIQMHYAAGPGLGW